MWIWEFFVTRDWESVKLTLDIITAGVVIPFGILTYLRNAQKEQRDREEDAYDALDDRYLEYLNFCQTHPLLDVFDVADANPAQLTLEQQKQELIAFVMLFTIFERAYLKYYDQATAIKAKQWSGWEKYIREFCKRGNFRKAWKTQGTLFDQGFEAYMKAVIGSHERDPGS